MPFVKGKSGNPGGRVRTATVALRHAILEHAGKPDRSKDGRGRARMRVMLDRLYKEDLKTYLAYGWGKPVETVQLQTSAEADTSLNPKVIELAVEVAKAL